MRRGTVELIRDAYADPDFLYTTDPVIIDGFSGPREIESGTRCQFIKEVSNNHTMVTFVIGGAKVSTVVPNNRLVLDSSSISILS